MARRVFFSFDYDEDIWRVNQIRNSWRTMDAVGRTGKAFYDASLWEPVKRPNDSQIRHAIDEGVKNTSVTAVLVGVHTAQSKWVRYEIEKSVEKGNGLLAVRIHRLKKSFARPEANSLHSAFQRPPANPIETVIKSLGGWDRLGYEPKTYDWKSHDGYRNFTKWVEQAARAAGR